VAAVAMVAAARGGGGGRVPMIMTTWQLVSLIHPVEGPNNVGVYVYVSINTDIPGTFSAPSPSLLRATSTPAPFLSRL